MLSPAEPEERAPAILVVDDEPDMCWALERILRPGGYTVVTTTSGTEALALLAEKQYALAFVDAKLGDVDGLELSALIRQGSPHTAIVLISGYFDRGDNDVTRGLQGDLFVSFITKPFDLAEIRAIVSQVMKME